MGLATAISAIGVGITAISAIGQHNAQQTMISEQKTASKRSENVRYQQMYLDSQRRKRQAVRESVMARATALSQGANQGAQGSSGLAAAMGQTYSRGLENQGTINASTGLGEQMFAANAAYSDATFNGQGSMSAWQGFGQFGRLFTNSGQQIARVGQQAMTGRGFA
jgi:hypothetical protein